MKKLFILFVAVLLIFYFNSVLLADEPYSEIYKQSGAEEIGDTLDNGTKEFFAAQDIDPADYDWVNSLKAENVFSHIFKFLKSGAKTPMRAGLSIVGIILIAAAFGGFQREKDAQYIKFAVTLAIIAALTSGVWSSINAAVNTVRGGSTFMLSFVPVYMGILSVSGAPVTAAASGGMLLGAAEFISGAAAFIVTSIMGIYLALSISSSVSPLVNGAGLAETFKKVGFWTMSLCTTVFLGVLAVQTAVNSAADSLTAKTAKFIIGTCVPVAGAAISGAVTTVSASVSLLKSSVGIYGVVALAVMFLPITAELLMWRLVLNLSSGVCTVFSMNETSKALKAVDSMLSLLIGTILLIEIMFIISLSVTLSAGKAL